MFEDPEPGVSDYTAMAADIKQVYDKLKLRGQPEVSDVHRNRSPFPADWALCLRNCYPIVGRIHGSDYLKPEPRQPFTQFFGNQDLVFDNESTRPGKNISVH